MRTFFFYIFGFLCLGLSVQARTISGVVSSEGKGLSAVVVSDGVTCVATDATGRYSLPLATDARYVYISTPAGYVTQCNGTIPIFYKEITENIEQYDFAILRNKRSDYKHTMIMQADVQSTSKENFETYKSVIDDCCKTIKECSKNDVFSIDCGDLVDADSKLMPAYIDAVTPIGIPVYHAIGNHDMDYWGRTHETSYKTYEKRFGPRCYSFNKGKVHYVVIDNNFFIGRDYFYMGYIDESTFHWLEQDMSFVPKGSTVILTMHIPSRLTEKKVPFEYDYSPIADQTVNAEALHNFFKDYNTHIISGHMHYNLNMCFNDRLMEHNTAAVCGTWWLADVCLDGTPRGYGVYEIDGDYVQWYYKSSGYNRTHQMRVYGLGRSKEHANDIVANVWNYDKKWKVEWLENGRVMGEMKKYTGYDPLAYDLCSDRSVITYDWISPMVNEHMFYATPHNAGAKMQVRVTDRFGNVYVEDVK